jgi:hypothetical protein
MAQKKAAKTTKTAKAAAKSTKFKKLSRFPNTKQMIIAFAAILIVTGIGTYALRETFALRLSPSMEQCFVFNPDLYRGVRNQEGCVTALQGFYRDKYGIRMSVDGLFGPQTEIVTKLYQGSRTSYPTVPKSGEVRNNNFNRTWAKLASDCYPNGRVLGICQRHHRY